jgi:hypothetical protein
MAEKLMRIINKEKGLVQCKVCNEYFYTLVENGKFLFPEDLNKCNNGCTVEA